MDISKLIAALAVSGGAVHPQGHVREGNDRGYPMTVDYGNLTESWGDNGPKSPKWTSKDKENASKYGMNLYDKSKEDEIAIQGAGFKAQDDIARIIEDKESKEAMYLANAILKGAQVAGLSKKLVKTSPEHPQNSDIDEMKKISGNKYVRPMMGFSAIMDLMKSQRPEQNWDVSAGVMPNSTAVGLTFNKRF